MAASATMGAVIFINRLFRECMAGENPFIHADIIILLSPIGDGPSGVEGLFDGPSARFPPCRAPRLRIDLEWLPTSCSKA